MLNELLGISGWETITPWPQVRFIFDGTTYRWSGACLIADRGECSDFQALMGAVLFDEKGKQIHEGSGFHYMNSGFDSTVYEVMANR